MVEKKIKPFLEEQPLSNLMLSLCLLKKEKLFYHFLWNSGPDRIKRKVMIKNISSAGLRLVEPKSCIKAL